MLTGYQIFIGKVRKCWNRGHQKFSLADVITSAA